MDHGNKVCETQPLLLLTPPSSSLCSQFYPNTPEIHTRAKENNTYYTCHQKGHWYRDCPFKSSNTGTFNNNVSQCAEKIWCRCGHGLCHVKTAKNVRNRGRMYYTCPIKMGMKCKEFVKWCDDSVVESDLQCPAFKYPVCKCRAGVCRRVKGAGSHGAVKYYFICPIKQYQGSCGYLVWEDELLDKESIGRQICKRTLVGFGEGDQNDQNDDDLDEGGNLLVNHSKKMRIMESSEDPTLMAVFQAELAQREDAALENLGSCLDLASEDELLDDLSIVQQSCKRTLNGYGEGDQNDNDLGEGDNNLLVKHSKKTRIMDSSEDSTLVAVSGAEFALREDASPMKASQLSCLSVSIPSRICSQQNFFQRHIYAGDESAGSTLFGFCSTDWLGRLLSSNPLKSLKIPSPQQIFCRVFPDAPKLASISDVSCGENNRLDVIAPSQQAQLSIDFHPEFSRDIVSLNQSLSSSSERKLMSRARRQRQVAFAQQQLLIDLATLEPHEHESMKEAADETFALLDYLGANDTQFSEHILDFISLTSSVAQMNETIEASLSPEEHSKCLEEEEAKFAHIRSLYANTEAQFKASDQRRQSLFKEISQIEAILVEKQNQLKSYQLETSNIEMELGDLRRNMLKADAALKTRAELAKMARELREERQIKQIAAKTTLQKAMLQLHIN